MLIIESLTHVYPGGVKALDEVDLVIRQGMFGLLGPNGAGKSTLMRIVATLLAPTSGHVRFGDIDVLKQPEALRRVLGYLPQDFGVYPRVSALDMLDHLAMLKGVGPAKIRKETVEGLLNQVNLWADRKKALAGFSGGMRQRFGIAQALLGDPKLMIVDEPTAGPRSRGAQPLPEPAGRDRRERGGDPVHPYRGGRGRPVPGHGDHLRRPHRASGRARRAGGRAQGPHLDQGRVQGRAAGLFRTPAGDLHAPFRRAHPDPRARRRRSGRRVRAGSRGLEDLYFSTLSNARRAAA